MSRIANLNRRYAASSAVARAGIEVVAVGDPLGARLDQAVRRLVAELGDDGPGPWDELIGTSKALRWRLLTQPQPNEFNVGRGHLIDEVRRQARRVAGAVAQQSLLDELAEAAEALSLNDLESPVGSALLEACIEAGPYESLVVAGSRSAKAGLDAWMGKLGISVLTVGELELYPLDRDRAYVVGPPRFFRSSLITAPVTDEVSFLLPAWFSDRTVPHSAIAPYAEGAIRIDARFFAIGELGDAVLPVSPEAADEDHYLPQPVWGVRKSDDREPTTDEVAARKVLLSGNLAIWLDDGERIRSLDPHQPSGERVGYTEVAAVRDGSYLLLRQGATERSAMYQAALAKLGDRAKAVDTTQTAWKQRLIQRLQRDGIRQVAKDLRDAGVKRADRARAWTDPYLIRPNSDQDFEALLSYLELPVQPTFGYASLLRKMVYQASAEVGKQLEAAVSASDLTQLDSIGHLSLDVATEGFRGILATRVVAVAPFSEIVPRHDARVPFTDRSAQWLE